MLLPKKTQESYLSSETMNPAQWEEQGGQDISDC